MAVIDGEPSGTQHLTPDREGNPQQSFSDHHPGGSTLHQLQMNLGDLADDELQWLMEDLHWEVAVRELNALPRYLPLTPWGNLVGNGDPNEDDCEVTFLRGEGGTHRSTSSTPATTQSNEDVGHLINMLAMGLQLSTPHINTFSSEAMSSKTEVSFEQ